MIAISDVAELNMLVARSEQHDLFMLSLSEDAVIVKEIGLQIDPERIAINHHAVFVHPFVVKKYQFPNIQDFP